MMMTMMIMMRSSILCLAVALALAQPADEITKQLGTIGTLHRPAHGHVTYTASSLPPTSAPSSAVYCLDCLRNATCTAGTPGSSSVGAMAFTSTGAGDWICDTGVSASIPDTYIPAIEGRVCIDSDRDPTNCVPGQIARTDGSAWNDFWEYWRGRVTNMTINKMRREVCDENIVRFNQTGLSTCESDDKKDLDDATAARDNARSRDLPIE